VYGYRPSTPADRILPLTDDIADVADRLTLIADIQDIVDQLLKLSKEIMAAISTRIAPFCQPGDLVYLSIQGLHIRSKKCKHLRDQKSGPYKVVSKVGIKSYKLVIPRRCRLYHVFHCDILYRDTSSTTLHPR